ncbi:MAG: NAD(P)H-dependent oxidoreductase subunit E [Ignavibacteriae bacterium]|nr:NAD(P)H-dependent oxidoreductase subunit E [Ignavibacteriota bacterium]
MCDTTVLRIVEKHKSDGDGIISILEDIQSKYSYLPESALKTVAEQTGKSLVDIYGVATFYRFFSLKPKGKHLINCCLGTACHVRGGQTIADEFEKKLKIKPGDTTIDKEFTFETVNCLGACALGPVTVVDGHYFSKVKTTIVKQILDEAKKGLDSIKVEGDKRIFPVEVSCTKCNHTLMDNEVIIDDFPSIRLTIAFKDKHGSLRLSGMYGSYNIVSEYEIPEEAIANFFCPHCNAEMKSPTICPECGEYMIPLMLKGGGIVQVCPRRGCKGHLLDLF